MAFDKRDIIELTRILILTIVAFPWAVSANTDCGGKAFHCINSTHFMICVDLGGGVSSTIDSFVIPCPPSTVCRGTNRFECEFLVPEMREQFTNTFVPDATELPLTTAVTSTPSATMFSQAGNDIRTLSTTEFPQFTTDLKAITELPHASTDIGTTNTTELFQDTTDITAYNTTESVQSSTDIFATELPPTPKDISASNIYLALTVFPQTRTGISVPNQTELVQAQTTESVSITTKSVSFTTESLSITTERFKDPTYYVTEASLFELPPTLRDVSVPNIKNSLAPTESPQTLRETTKSVSITTERFQDLTDAIDANLTKLLLRPKDISAPNISQAPTEFLLATEDISVPSQTELFQGQTAKSESITTERIQASTDVIEATELPLAPIYISATNNISEIDNISIAIATTVLPETLTDISTPNTLGNTQAPMDTIAPNITKSQAPDNGEHSTTEFSKILTNNIATTTQIDISTSIIKEHYETSTEHISVSIKNEISQASTNTDTTEIPQAPTDKSANNKTELSQKTTEASKANTTDISQTQTDVSATNITEQLYALTEIGAINTTQFLQATTDITAYITTETLQMPTYISEANVTVLSPPSIDISALNISQVPIEFPQKPTDIKSTNTAEFSQLLTDKSVPNTTEFPQVTKIWSPGYATTFKPDREVQVLVADDNIVSKRTTQESVTNKHMDFTTSKKSLITENFNVTNNSVTVIAVADPFENEKPKKTELNNDKKIEIRESITNNSTLPLIYEITRIAGELEVSTISTTDINDIFGEQSEVAISKVPTDSTTFDTTQTNANTLSHEITTESARTVNVSSNYKIVDITRLIPEETLSTEINPVIIDLNMINPEVSTTPSIVQSEVSIHSSLSQVSSNEVMYNNSEVTPTLSYLNVPKKESVNYSTDTPENYSRTTGNPVKPDNNILLEIIDSITQSPFSYESFKINDKMSNSTLDDKSKSTNLPNETTYKYVTTELYENLAEDATTLVSDRSRDSITQNYTLTTSGPILTGFEVVSTNTFVEPTNFVVNAYTKLEPNKLVPNKPIDPYENSKDQHETNVKKNETNTSTTNNQTWPIGLEVTQASVEIEQLNNINIPTWSSGTSDTIITEPTVSKTEEKLQAVIDKNTETSSGIDQYTPIQQITDSNQYSFNAITTESKFKPNIFPKITSESIVQQNLNSKQNSFNNENIAQLPYSPEELTKTSPHNMVVVNNQHANIPIAGYINRQSSKNQDAVTELYSDLSVTNVNYFDKALSTSNMNKMVLMANTGIEQGFVTEPYTTGGLKNIYDVPVSTTEISQYAFTTKVDFQQGVTEHKDLTADLHATLSPWGLNTKLATNMDVGLHGFSTAPNVPAHAQTASQNTLIEQGDDLRTINASLSSADNVQSISRNTTETSIGDESITSTSSTNSISANELALAVSHTQIPLQKLVEQNVRNVNMVFTNKTDLNGGIVSNSPTDEILNAPLSNFNIEHGAHFVQNYTVRSYSPADNVSTITNIEILRNRTTSLPSANKQSESHNNLTQFEVTNNNISTQNITTFFNNDSNDTNVFSSYENGINSSLQNITNSTESIAMPIITQITTQNSTNIGDVTQISTNDTGLNILLMTSGNIQTALRNTEDISVSQLFVSSNNFTFMNSSFDVNRQNDSNIVKQQSTIGSNMDGSSLSTIMDNLSPASLDQFMNVKQETPNIYTSPKNKDFKLLPDLSQNTSIKSISIQQGYLKNVSTSTSSNVDSIIPNRTSSASVNANIMVNSQVSVDINDHISLSSPDPLAGREFLITTEHIVDKKMNLNQEKSIGNMKEVVELSPLLDLMQNVTRKTGEVTKIKFTKSSRISSNEFGNPGIESNSNTQSSFEKFESLQSVPDAVKILSKNNTRIVVKSKETNINNSNTTNIEQSIQSSTTTNKENNLKITPSLGHANTSSKIKSSKSGILNHPKSSVQLYCRNRNRGRYSDRQDCSKFYVCIGRLEPIIGRCPANTVFSDIKKQCTKNMSHCIREREFKCTFAGRYSDILQENIYYICVQSGDVFIRFKFQCQNGYNLNKASVKCDKQSDLELRHQTSISQDSKSEKSTNDDRSTKQNTRHDKQSNKSVDEFKCKEEGRFGDANNCRKYYVCTKRNKKLEFRRRKKKCDSDEVFHKEEKKCVDAESYEC